MAENRILSLQLRVGITVGATLALLILTLLTVGKFHFGESGYPLDVTFQFVDAIKPQADVVIGGGVKIGHVSEIAVVGDRVHLKVMVNAPVKIPRDAKFQILSKGLMGDKYLNVAAQTGSGEYFKPGETVEGVEPSNMDKAFQRLGQVADSIKFLLGDPEVKTSFSDMLKNFGKFSGRLDRIFRVNEDHINNSLKDFSEAAASIKRISSETEILSRSLNDLLAEDNRQNFRGLLKNLQKASWQLNEELVRIEKGKGALAVLLNDEEVGRDLKDLVKDLKSNPWKLLWK